MPYNLRPRTLSGIKIESEDKKDTFYRNRFGRLVAYNPKTISPLNARQKKNTKKSTSRIKIESEDKKDTFYRNRFGRLVAYNPKTISPLNARQKKNTKKSTSRNKVKSEGTEGNFCINQAGKLVAYNTETILPPDTLPKENTKESTSRTNFKKNVARQRVSYNTAPILPPEIIISPDTVLPIESSPKDSTKPDDSESKSLRYGWKMIGLELLPFILRVIDGKYVEFIAVRIAETRVLQNYLQYINLNVYTNCLSVRSHFITKREARLLNHINIKHCDKVYGEEKFISGKDIIVRLSDVHEFFLFLEKCCDKIKKFTPPSSNDKFGFMIIHSESVVPFVTIDNQRYVSIMHFEEIVDKFKQIKIEKWDLSYLKFCFMVQGIFQHFIQHLSDSDSCIVISLQELQEVFPGQITDYLKNPYKSNFLINQLFGQVNYPSGCWVIPPYNVQDHSYIVPSTPAAISIPIGSPLNQIISGNQNTRNTNLPVNDLLSPLDQMSIMKTQIVNKIMDPSQTPTPVIHQMDNSDVMSQQKFAKNMQFDANNQGLYNEMWQQHQQQQQDLNRQRHQQRMVTHAQIPRVNLTTTYSSIPPTIGWRQRIIPEVNRKQGNIEHLTYKIIPIRFHGKIVHTINSKTSKHMMSLEELVEVFFKKSTTVGQIAIILTEKLKRKLYTGNADQILLLRQHKLIRTSFGDKTPFIMIKDLECVFIQLKTLVNEISNVTDLVQNQVITTYPPRHCYPSAAAGSAEAAAAAAAIEATRQQTAVNNVFCDTLRSGNWFI